jgi:drug/metabolite transporter (DMT)-like permease
VTSINGRSASVLAVWWLTCLIWSSIPLFIKIGVGTMPPLTFAAARLALAAGILGALALARGTEWPARGRDRLLTAVSGLLLLGLNYGFAYWGARFISSGVAAVLQASVPAFSLMFGALLATERLTAGRVVGVLLGLGGVSVIFRDQITVGGTDAFAGAAAVTAGAACVAVAYGLVKKYGRGIPSTTLMAGQMLAALGPLGITAIATEGNPFSHRWSTGAIVALVYLTLAGSVIASRLNYWLLKRMDATTLLSMGFVEPLIAVLLGGLFLGERVTLQTGLGGVAILASVWTILRQERSAKMR